jgi:hypothetical protein
MSAGFSNDVFAAKIAKTAKQDSGMQAQTQLIG